MIWGATMFWTALFACADNSVEPDHEMTTVSEPDLDRDGFSYPDDCNDQDIKLQDSPARCDLRTKHKDLRLGWPVHHDVRNPGDQRRQRG